MARLGTMSVAISVAMSEIMSEAVLVELLWSLSVTMSWIVLVSFPRDHDNGNARDHSRIDTNKA